VSLLIRHWSFDPFVVLAGVLVVVNELGLARMRPRSTDRAQRSPICRIGVERLDLFDRGQSIGSRPHGDGTPELPQIRAGRRAGYDDRWEL